MEKTRLVVGNPARGDDLWDREAEIEEIWRVLQRDHVLLVAPRRFGKTSIMLDLMYRPKDGYKVFYLDTEWIRGPEYFIAEVATELLSDNVLRQALQQVGGFLSGVINRISEIQITEVKLGLRQELAEDWQDKGRELISHLKKFDGTILIIVDELPLMIDRMRRENASEAEGFLHWMRAVRQMPELSNVRFVVGGSIGIEHVLKQVGTGVKVINDLHRIPVGPFSEQQCREFIKALLGNEMDLQDVAPEILKSFIDILETPVPYFIQILVSEAIREAENQAMPLSPEVIEKAYNERVLAAYNRTYFEHYYARLRDYYSEGEEKLAKAFLLEIAKRNQVPRSHLWELYQNLLEGKGDEENFSYLLSDLENDFYIQYDPARRVYHFATKVLKDWWLRHHAIVQ